MQRNCCYTLICWSHVWPRGFDENYFAEMFDSTTFIAKSDREYVATHQEKIEKFTMMYLRILFLNNFNTVQELQDTRA